jgi:hypothetical protein
MLVPTSGLPMQIHPSDGFFSASPIAGAIHELVDFAEAPCCADSGVTGSAPRRPR